MPIRLDFTKETVVIVCDKCPHWRALRFDRETAWQAAAGHQSAAHPGDSQSRLAFGMYRRRNNPS